MVDKIKTKALEDNAVNESKLRLSNNSFLRGRNQANSADVDVVKVNASDELELGKLPYGPNSNAPVADAQLANKKYVDDAVADFSGALVYRGTLAAGSTITGNATGNAYLDGGTGLVKGDYFKITGSGNITTSDGTIAVDAGDALIANKDVALDASIVNADLDKIDNTEAADILRSGDLASAQLFVGNASNEAAAVTVSGDVTFSNTGVTTIANNAVTAVKIASDAVTTVKILDANVTAAKLASDSVTTVKILDANVTTAKIADNAITEAKLDSGVNAATFVVEAGYDSSVASGNVAAGQTIQAALEKIEKKADDALAGAGADPETQTITLDSTAVNTNKYVDLAFEARDHVLLSFKGSDGALFLPTTDFTTALSGAVTRISWTGLGLDGYAEVGDKWLVTYIKA